MSHVPTIGLLGAEKQAASSVVLAWPEYHFVLVSDQKVLDGWDLPNVRILFGRPDQPRSLPVDEWLPLCPRWIDCAMAEPANHLGDFRLSTVLSRLERAFPGMVLPASPVPCGYGPSIVKGDRFHRPDAVQFGKELGAEEISDPHGCGVLFQPYIPQARTYLATGRCWPEGIQLAVVALHSEACARDEVLQAGETIAHQAIADQTRTLLSCLGHRGFFTCNWIERDGRTWLTSVRPVPRAVFGTLRRAGLNLFRPPTASLQIARSGFKFALDLHYSSYRALSA